MNYGPVMLSSPMIFLTHIHQPISVGRYYSRLVARLHIQVMMHCLSRRSELIHKNLEALSRRSQRSQRPVSRDSCQFFTDWQSRAGSYVGIPRAAGHTCSVGISETVALIAPFSSLQTCGSD